VKENLKIAVKSDDEKEEIQNLFFALGYFWSGEKSGYVKNIFHIRYIYLENEKLFYGEDSAGFTLAEHKLITLPELRELARPKEYLNSEFELVVTNQPEDGWVLVPDGANKLTRAGEDYDVFWQEEDRLYVFLNSGSWDLCESGFMDEHAESWGGNVKILWQRENKVETVKGRFLHQWAYEAFGRGEDVQLKANNESHWNDFSVDHVNFHFNRIDVKFRLKPQTIQIGSRTINKPISVKPEIGDIVYVANLTDIDLVTEQKWKNTALHIHFFDMGLLHKSKEDALNHSMALIETMK